MQRRVLRVLIVAGAMLAAFAPTVRASVAPGAPGSPSFFDLARVVRG